MRNSSWIYQAFSTMIFVILCCTQPFSQDSLDHGRIILEFNGTASSRPVNLKRWACVHSIQKNKILLRIVLNEERTDVIESTIKYLNVDRLVSCPLTFGTEGTTKVERKMSFNKITNEHIQIQFSKHRSSESPMYNGSISENRISGHLSWGNEIQVPVTLSLRNS